MRGWLSFQDRKGKENDSFKNKAIKNFYSGMVDALGKGKSKGKGKEKCSEKLATVVPYHYIKLSIASKSII